MDKSIKCLKTRPYRFTQKEITIETGCLCVQQSMYEHSVFFPRFHVELSIASQVESQPNFLVFRLKNPFVFSFYVILKNRLKPLREQCLGF